MEGLLGSYFPFLLVEGKYGRTASHSGAGNDGPVCSLDPWVSLWTSAYFPAPHKKKVPCTCSETPCVISRDVYLLPSPIRLGLPNYFITKGLEESGRGREIGSGAQLVVFAR